MASRMGILGDRQRFGLLDQPEYAGVLNQPPASFWELAKMTWPVRMAQAALGAAALPGDVYAGRTRVMDPMTGRTSEDVIGRSADLAGLAAIGSGPFAPRGAVGAGAVRRPKTKLPMDEASRMARASEAGFYMDLPLYHGTNKTFSSFEKGAAKPGAEPGQQGVWTALDPKAADEFAQVAAGRSQGNAQIYPLRHRAKKSGVIQLSGDEQNHEIAATLAQAWDDGFDAVMLRNYTTPAGKMDKNILVVRDPAQLRSPYAAFDPAKSLSADILASGGRGGKVAGGAVLAAKDKPQGILAYHGSPHDFERFSMKRIGTGEGAQAYGRGLYFAEKEATARSYREALAQEVDNKWLWKGEPLPASESRYFGGRTRPITGDDYTDEILREMADRPYLSIDDAAANVKQRLQRAAEDADSFDYPTMRDLRRTISDIQKHASRPTEGTMYKVRINAHPDEFLDWDKPLSEQSAAIQKLAKDPSIRKSLDFQREFLGSEPHGVALYTALSRGPYGNAAAGSEALRAAGIKGIRYHDQGSRGSGKGTYNYVVFDDKIIDILKKYGVPGLIAAGMGAEMAKGVAKQYGLPEGTELY